MLRSSPRRRRKSAAESSTSGDRSPRTGSPETWQHRPRASAGPIGEAIGEAYGRFLELPVPVVLVALWLFGVLLLALLVGVVAVLAYSAEAVLAATALAA